MAEDTTKKGENGESEEPENKDWDWEAATPDAPTDTLDFAELSHDAVHEQTAEEAEESDEPEINDSEEENDEHKPGFCVICGEPIRRSPSSVYCNVCREKYLCVGYGARHIILSIVMIIVAVVGIVAFMTSAKIVKNVFEGDKALKQSQYANALDSYNSVDSTVTELNSGFNKFLQGISENFGEVDLFKSGKAVDKKLVKVKLKTLTWQPDDLSAFVSLVDSAYSEKELKNAENKDIKDCYDYCKSAYATYGELQQEWSSLIQEYMGSYDEDGNQSGESTVTEADIITYLKNFEEENPDADKSTIEYFRFITYYYGYIYFNKTETDNVLSQLQKAYEAAGDFGYLYASDYISIAYSFDKYDVALETAQKQLKVNPSDETAYQYSAKIHAINGNFDDALKDCESLKEYNPDSLQYYALQAEVLRRKGDFTAAVDICEKGKKAGSDSGEFARQEAIAYMLSGEKDKALEQANESYETAYSSSYNGGSVSLEVVNTSALICYLCGDEETYDEIKTQLSNQSYELEDSVKSVISGDKTFEDLFMSGKGDI